jgi:hypothetical protein
MRIALLTLSLLCSLGSKSFACGDVGDCTAGFSQGDDGHFYTETQISLQPQPGYVPSYTYNVIKIFRIRDFDFWTIYHSNGNVGFADISPVPRGPAKIYYFPRYTSSASQPNYRYIKNGKYPASDLSEGAFKTLYTSGACSGNGCGGAGKGLGTVDSAKVSSGSVIVSGWACQKGLNKSIAVYVYATDAVNGKFVTSAIANLAPGSTNDKAAISYNCNSLVNHRYHIKIPAATYNRYQGQRLAVYAVTTPNGIVTLTPISSQIDFKFP